MCLNELEFLKFLKLTHIPVFIDYDNIEEGNYNYKIPIYIVNDVKTLHLIDLPLEKKKIE